MISHRMKRVSLYVLVLLLLSFSLAACGGETPTSPDGVVTVNWWSWNPGDEKGQRLAEAFNAEHSDIKLVYTQQEYTDYTSALKLAMSSGTGPDVLGLQAGGFLTQYAEFLEDLAPYEEAEYGASWQERYYGSALEQLQRDDQTLALPFFVSAAGYLWYNKTIFDEHGVQPPATYNDWVQVAQELSSKGVTPFIHGAKDAWQNLDMYIALANSIAPGKIYDAIDGTVPWTDPDLTKAMQTWKDMFGNGIMQNGALSISAYPDAHDKWAAGEAAMILFGSWENSIMTNEGLKLQQETLGFSENYEFLPIPFPRVGNEPSRLFGGPDVGLGINRDSAVKDAAWEVVKWLNSAEGGQKINAETLDTPSLVDVAMNDSDMISEEQKSALAQEQTDLTEMIGPREIPYADLGTALGDALQNVASDQQSVQQAMEAIQQASQAIQR